MDIMRLVSSVLLVAGAVLLCLSCGRNSAPPAQDKMALAEELVTSYLKGIRASE